MQGSIERARERFKRTLKERLSLRVHMFLLLLAVFLLAAGVSYVLYHVGVRSMPLRYGLVTLIAYGAFFLLMRLWLYYLVDTAEVREETELVLRTAQRL